MSNGLNEKFITNPWSFLVDNVLFLFAGVSTPVKGINDFDLFRLKTGVISAVRFDDSKTAADSSQDPGLLVAMELREDGNGTTDGHDGGRVFLHQRSGRLPGHDFARAGWRGLRGAYRRRREIRHRRRSDRIAVAIGAGNGAGQFACTADGWHDRE